MSTTTSDKTAHANGNGGDGDRMHLQKRMYMRFGAMIATSTVVMFFLMYSTIWAVDHARWSEMRFYMAVFMGGMMTVIMMGFMWGMYENNRWNIGILLAGIALFSVGLGLARSQLLVDDQSYMKAMIPHHSIAILTSERAGIDDVRVRELADEIIEAQRREIEEMDWLIKDIEENGVVTSEEEAAERPVPDFEVDN